MFAVIKTGGKQYLVNPGTKLKIEKLDAREGDSFAFNEVLLTVDKDEVKIGTPLIEGTYAEARVMRQGRAKKVIVFRYHPKTRYRKKKGHRQEFTEVEIQKIVN